MLADALGVGVRIVEGAAAEGGPSWEARLDIALPATELRAHLWTAAVRTARRCPGEARAGPGAIPGWTRGMTRARSGEG